MSEIESIAHSSEVATISEDISSILRAARAELLYPGNNGTHMQGIADQLEAIANGIDHTRMFDEMDPTDMRQFIIDNATLLSTLHPSLLVRKLTSYLLDLPIIK